jgi:kinesin family protein 2/24
MPVSSYHSPRLLITFSCSLAGSERYEDSKDHDKQRMDEVRENNKGLMNLKECVRAKAKMASEDGFVHIPWRAHKLTMLLKASSPWSLGSIH